MPLDSAERLYIERQVTLARAILVALALANSARGRCGGAGRVFILDAFSLCLLVPSSVLSVRAQFVREFADDARPCSRGDGRGDRTRCKFGSRTAQVAQPASLADAGDGNAHFRSGNGIPWHTRT